MRVKKSSVENVKKKLQASRVHVHLAAAKMLLISGSCAGS